MDMRVVLRAVSRVLPLTVLAGLCASCGSGQPTVRPEVRSAAALSIQAVDALEQQSLPCPAELLVLSAGKMHISSTGEIDSQSLYLHLRYAPESNSVDSVRLSPLLEGRAVLLSIADEPGLLRLGLVAIGAGAKLPADSDLIEVQLSNAAQGAAPRSSSAAPATAVADLAFSAEDPARLEWTYYVNGDYDQNGSVTIGDVTPIGQHFGKGSASADWNIARAADGDSNGLISISDLTPIGANFGSRVSSFAVRTAGSAAGPFSFVEGSLSAFADFPQPQAGGPRRFSHALASGIDGNFYVVTARDGAEESSALSNAVEYQQDNLAPGVQIDIDEAFLPPGAAAQLTAQYQDSDGTIEAVRWDLDGDGAFETAVPVGDPSVQSAPLTRLGTSEIGIRVTDDAGQHGYDSVEVTVSFGEPAVRVLQSGDVFNEPSLELISGRPMAAAYASVAKDLNYYRASSESGLNWFSPQKMPGIGEVVGVDISAVALNPAIVTGEASDEGHFMRALDTLGENWGPTYSMPPNNPGEFCSGGVCLGEDGGMAVVVFGGDGEGSHGNIIYQRAQQLDGSEWTFPQAINSSLTDYGTRPSLRIINGRTHVAYMGGTDMTSAQIYYVYAENDSETDWTTPVGIGTPSGSYAGSFSLTQIDGTPSVAFWDSAGGNMGFSRAVSQDLFSWSSPSTIAASGQTANGLSLRNINGLPHVAWYDITVPGFRLACAMDAEGEFWNDAVDAAVASTPGQVSLAELNDRPMLLISDVSAQELRFIVYQQPGG